MKNITLKDLKEALRYSWHRETSYSPESWTPENPAFGQCYVTMLVAQDYFGGKTVRVNIPDIGWHYWNLLPDGIEMDLTKSQFAKDVVIPRGRVITVNREKAFKFCPSVARRYKILKQRVEEILKNRGGTE